MIVSLPGVYRLPVGGTPDKRLTPGGTGATSGADGAGSAPEPATARDRRSWAGPRVRLPEIVVIPVSALPPRPSTHRITVAPGAIPAPRAASSPVTRRADASSAPQVRIPAPRGPVDDVRARHRAMPAPRSRTDRTLTVLGRAGSVTTLAALLVLSAALTGQLDGVAPTGPAADVITSTLP